MVTTTIICWPCRSAPRVQTRSEPEGEDGGERDGGQEVGRELVIAGGYAPEVLEPAEGVFDQVAIPISILVVDDLLLAGDAARDHRYGSGLAYRPAYGVGVVALVGQNIAGCASASEELGSDGHVGDVARREDQRERASDDVGEGVDLGGLATA
jgi:hypothetical protein